MNKDLMLKKGDILIYNISGVIHECRVELYDEKTIKEYELEQSDSYDKVEVLQVKRPSQYEIIYDINKLKNNTKDASYDIFFEEHKEEVEEIRKICEEIANDKKLMKKLKKFRKKLNAEELFESLGYRKFENEYWIYYSKETDGTYPVDRIYFVKNTKEIKAETITYDKTLVKNVTTSELQAINQQCKELGWLD